MESATIKVVQNGYIVTITKSVLSVVTRIFHSKKEAIDHISKELSGD